MSIFRLKTLAFIVFILILIASGVSIIAHHQIDTDRQAHSMLSNPKDVKTTDGAGF